MILGRVIVFGRVVIVIIVIEILANVIVEISQIVNEVLDLGRVIVVDVVLDFG